jgi:molybdopterin converting factor small subunit
MANTKISNLTALAEAPATTDLVAIVDVSASETKKLTVANLIDAVEGNANTFTAPQTVNARMGAQGFGTSRAIVDDDTVTTITPVAGITRGMLLLTNSGGAGSNRSEINAIIAFAVPATSSVAIIAQVASRVEAATGVLTGTTGSDTKVTVSVDSDTGLIYIENRIGSQATISAMVIG